jgi:cytidine deaminase
MKQKLIEAATSARSNAYCPYSRYAVGAAILTADGNIVLGCNVENAVFPLGQCAERVAIQTMVASGSIKIVGIAISTKDGGMPCGACRQVMCEFADPQCAIYVVAGDGSVSEYALSDLLPSAFKL